MYPGDRFYFISGSEGFLKIRTWKNYQLLLRMVTFIVVLRQANHKKEVAELLSGEGIAYRDFDGRIDEEPGQEEAAYLFDYRSDKCYISSTLIRRKVKLAEPVDDLIHEGVKKIMEEKRLYES